MNYKTTRVNHKKFTNSQKAEIIEYWLANPGLTMKYIAEQFNTNLHTVSNMITRDYLGKALENPITITKQSKINIPEYSLLTI